MSIVGHSSWSQSWNEWLSGLEDAIFGTFHALRTNVDDKVNILNKSITFFYVFIVHIIQLIQVITLTGRYDISCSIDKSWVCLLNNFVFPLTSLSNDTSTRDALCILIGVISLILLATFLYIAQSVKKRNINLNNSTIILLIFLKVVARLYIMDIVSFFWFVIRRCQISALDVTLISISIAIVIPLALLTAYFHNKNIYAHFHPNIQSQGFLELLFSLHTIFIITSLSLQTTQEENKVGLAVSIISLVISFALGILHSLQSPFILPFENIMRTITYAFLLSVGIDAAVFSSNGTGLNRSINVVLACIFFLVFELLRRYRLAQHASQIHLLFNYLTTFNSAKLLEILQAQYRLEISNEDLSRKQTVQLQPADFHCDKAALENYKKDLETLRTSVELRNVKCSLVFSNDIEYTLRSIFEEWHLYNSDQKNVAKLLMFLVHHELIQDKNYFSISILSMASISRLLFNDFEMSGEIIRRCYDRLAFSAQLRYIRHTLQIDIDTVRVINALGKKAVRTSLADLELYRKMMTHATRNHIDAIKNLVKGMKYLVLENKTKPHLNVSHGTESLKRDSKVVRKSYRPETSDSENEDNRSHYLSTGEKDTVKAKKSISASAIAKAASISREHIVSLQQGLHCLVQAESAYEHLLTKFPNNADAIRLSKIFKNHFHKEDFTMNATRNIERYKRRITDTAESTSSYNNNSHGEWNAMGRAASEDGIHENDHHNGFANSMDGQQEGAKENSSEASSQASNSFDKDNEKRQKINRVSTMLTKSFTWVSIVSTLSQLLFLVMMIITTVVITTQFQFITDRIQNASYADSLLTLWPRACDAMDRISLLTRESRNTLAVMNKAVGEIVSTFTLDTLQLTEADVVSMCGATAAYINSNVSTLTMYGCFFVMNDSSRLSYYRTDPANRGTILPQWYDPRTIAGDILETPVTWRANWYQTTVGKVTMQYFARGGTLASEEQVNIFGEKRIVTGSPLYDYANGFAGVLGVEFSTDGTRGLMFQAKQEMHVMDPEYLKGLHMILQQTSVDDNVAVCSMVMDERYNIRAISPLDTVRNLKLGIQAIIAYTSNAIRYIIEESDKHDYNEISNHPHMILMQDTCKSIVVETLDDLIRESLAFVSNFIDASIAAIISVMMVTFIVLLVAFYISIRIVRTALTQFDTVDGVSIGVRILCDFPHESRKIIYDRLNGLVPPKALDSEQLLSGFNNHSSTQNRIQKTLADEKDVRRSDGARQSELNNDRLSLNIPPADPNAPESRKARFALHGEYSLSPVDYGESPADSPMRAKKFDFDNPASVQVVESQKEDTDDDIAEERAIDEPTLDVAIPRVSKNPRITAKEKSIEEAIPTEMEERNTVPIMEATEVPQYDIVIADSLAEGNYSQLARRDHHKASISSVSIVSKNESVAFGRGGSPPVTQGGFKEYLKNTVVPSLTGKISRWFFIITLILCSALLATTLTSLSKIRSFSDFQTDIRTIATVQSQLSSSMIRAFDLLATDFTPPMAQTSNAQLRSEFIHFVNTSYNLFIPLSSKMSYGESIMRRFEDRKSLMFDNVCIDSYEGCDLVYDGSAMMKTGLYKAFLFWVERAQWFYDDNTRNPVASLDRFSFIQQTPKDVHTLRYSFRQIINGLRTLRQTFVDESDELASTYGSNQVLFCALNLIICIISTFAIILVLRREKKRVSEACALLKFLPLSMIIDQRIFMRYFMPKKKNSQQQDEWETESEAEDAGDVEVTDPLQATGNVSLAQNSAQFAALSNALRSFQQRNTIKSS